MGLRAAKPQTGVAAYTINLIPENKLDGGQYADVFKIQKIDSQQWYAAKFLKVPLSFVSSLDKLGYDRELQILKETDHPFVIKY